MPPAADPKKAKRSPLATLGSALLVLLVAGLFFMFGVVLFGGVSVDEFSPYSLKRRNSSYYRLPLTNLQITPASQSDTTGSLELYLVNNKIVTATVQPKRWDVVRVNPLGVEADADFLCFYFDTPYDWVMGMPTPSGGTRTWEAWSKDNPKMAKRFWPVVIELARAKMYTLIPELFEICERANNVEQLGADLDQHLPPKLLKMADDAAKLSDFQRSVAIYSVGLKVVKDDPQLLAERARAYRELGRFEEAQRDRQAIGSVADQADDTP